jgi:hypothetical protein
MPGGGCGDEVTDRRSAENQGPSCPDVDKTAVSRRVVDCWRDRHNDWMTGLSQPRRIALVAAVRDLPFGLSRYFPSRVGPHRGARVNTPLDLANDPSSQPQQPVPAAPELGLAALLELFATAEVAMTTPRRSLRSSGARLRPWTPAPSRRAARRCAVAGVTE